VVAPSRFPQIALFDGRARGKVKIYVIPVRRSRCEMSYTGESVNRPDSIEKVTGEAVYAGDKFLPNMLHASLKRSPFSHAVVTDIDTSEAADLDGVKAILTPSDLPDPRPGGGLPQDQGVLNEKMRFQGDVVAAVAAEDPETAATATQLIDVDYERLPAVHDPEEAMEDGAPTIHEDAENNVAGTSSHEVGDVEAAFEEADHVVETTATTSRQCHVTPETYSCVADFNDQKKYPLEVWTSVDKPYYFRDELARILDMSPGDLRVQLPPASSASLGKKNYLIPNLEPAAALLSKRADRPVRLSLSRDEDFVGTVTRHPCRFRLKSGVTDDGEIVARSCHMVSDTGGYVQMGNHVKDAIKSRFVDLYQCDNVRFEAYNVYTNNPMAGSARGIGSTQIHYAMEVHMDEIAERLEIDPVSLRQDHHIREGQEKVGGATVESCGLGECLSRGAEAANWPVGRVTPDVDDPDTLTGVGMACGIHLSGSTRDRGCSANIKFNSDGSIDLLITNPDSGHGSDTIEAQVAAEELGVRPERIHVSDSDTAFTPPDSYGSTASRSSYVATRAVAYAARNTREKLLEQAADTLGHDPAELTVEDGQVRAPDGSETPIVEAVDGLGNIQGAGSFENPKSRSTFGAYFAEVSVDVPTGEVTVERMVAAQDVGYVINPAGCEAQVEGGVEFAMEFLLEELSLERGQPENNSMVDYNALAAESVPDDIESIFVESNAEMGIEGAKGLGTGVMPPIAPAISNAVHDATGARVTDIPLRAEDVFTQIHEEA
jgi:CO/xanthine dehydrogenase Mo-binding subunit